MGARLRLKHRGVMEVFSKAALVHGVSRGRQGEHNKRGEQQPCSGASSVADHWSPKASVGDKTSVGDKAAVTPISWLQPLPITHNAVTTQRRSSDQTWWCSKQLYLSGQTTSGPEVIHQWRTRRKRKSRWRMATFIPAQLMTATSSSNTSEGTKKPRWHLYAATLTLFGLNLIHIHFANCTNCIMCFLINKTLSLCLQCVHPLSGWTFTIFPAKQSSLCQNT